jgi:N-acetylglutamate synthase-like GNAT family acetyltransferase
MAVNPRFRHEGIGSQLTDFVKQRCIEENLPQITTRTFFGENLEFFKKRGFVEIGVLKGPFVPVHLDRIYFVWKNPHYKE